MTDGDENKRVKMVKYLLGSSGRELYDTFDFVMPEAERTVKIILDKFDTYMDPKKNEIIERYTFFTRKQELGETIDKYFTELKMLSKDCNFATLRDSLIRDRIVCGIKDNQLRERLLRVADLTLDKCVKDCQASELSKLQMKTLDKDTPSTLVHAVSSRGHGGARPKHHNAYQTKRDSPKIHDSSTQSKKMSQSANAQILACKFCGGQHERNRSKCPAYGKTCSNCKRRNHFAKVCRRGNSVHQIEAEYDLYTVNVNTVNQINHAPSVYATMLVNDKPVKFQIDSGARCNVIPYDLLDDESRCQLLTHKQPVLTMYNNATIKSLGICDVNLTNAKTHCSHKVNFVVVNGDYTPLLGCSASQRMNLIRFNRNNIMSINTESVTTQPLSLEQLIAQYDDVFCGTGLLDGKYHIVLDENIAPVVHAPRRVPLALRNRLKVELQRLTELQIITPVTEPTPWVSSLVLVQRGEKLRICIDPKDLNTAIQRSHYPLPTLDDVLPHLSKAKVYSVLDARNGFWHVALDEQSSHTTTFNTPFGRYRWLRMPFGVKSAPEEFQRRQDQALEGLDGVVCIADDILVYGEGSTMAQAIIDHDRKLHRLLQ
jgi:hypothetical protein